MSTIFRARTGTAMVDEETRGSNLEPLPRRHDSPMTIGEHELDLMAAMNRPGDGWVVMNYSAGCNLYGLVFIKGIQAIGIEISRKKEATSSAIRPAESPYARSGNELCWATL